MWFRLIGLVAFCFVACSSTSDDLPCVNVSTDCQPVVTPTFEAIHTNILRQSCATGTGRCHNESAAANLDMRNIDTAYGGLRSRVDPANLSCSLLIRRIEAAESGVRMPPGPTPLTEQQRCAIRQWIKNGAQR
jgi:hypothetical protein